MTKILIAFERSGVVRRAFAARGFDAWSCDLQPALDGSSNHLQMDIRPVLSMGWDMMVAHPPCTFTCYAGARWWKRPGWREQQELALGMFWTCLNAPIEYICCENPRGLPMTEIRKPDDVIQPYEFGDAAEKRTYLWLVNLPPLMRTYILQDYEHNWTVNQRKDRSNARSQTFPGIASAMAAQWSFVPKRA